MRQQAFVLLCLCIISCSGVFTSAAAQGTAITYGVSQGTYQEITGGNLLATGAALDGYTGTVLLPFTYTWAGDDYTQVDVAGGSGAVMFGSNTIYAWGSPLSASVNGTLRTQTLGTTPDRTVVIQWRNATRSPQGSSQDQYNIQVRIHEGGSVDVIYGAMTVSAYVQPLIGATSAGQNIFLSASYWHSSWMMPTVSASELRSEVITGWSPVAGTTYSYRESAALDASVVALSQPVGTFDAGQPVTVKAMVMNRGTTPLTSVQVAWSISGVAQPTVTYDANPALQSGEVIEVQLGTFTPTATSFNTVIVSTTNPNGGADNLPDNDALVAYLAPRVEGMLNVIQNGAAGAFTSVSAGIRHLANSGLKGDVQLRIFGTEYNEQIIVPDVPASDHTITLFAAESYTPNFVFAPSNQPGYGLLDELEHGLYQVYVVGEHAHVVLQDLRFSLPEDGLWGGHIFALDAKGLTVRNCEFVGVNDYANTVADATSMFVVRTPFTFHNSSIRNMDVAIMVDNMDSDLHPIVIDSSHFTSIRSDAILAAGLNIVVDANHVTSDSTSDGFNGIVTIGAGQVSANSVTAHLGGVSGSDVVGVGAFSMNGSSGGDHGIDLYNNMISVSGTEQVRGIMVVPSSASDHTRIVFNTVLVSGTAAADHSTAMVIGRDLFPGMQQPQGEAYTVVNNIFTNRSEPGGFAVVNQLDYVNTCDYNNLMTTGLMIGRFNGTDVPLDTVGHPLASWRAATGHDINSSSETVSFVGENDLHLAALSTGLLGASSGMAVTNMDIDGQQRIAPYMGADEAIPVPVITKQPLGRYACIGEEMQFSIEATVLQGATVTYQWYRDGRPIVSATGPILQFTFVTYSASGVYFCEVIATDGFHTERVMSEPATLFVVRPTEVIEQPVSQPAAPGSTVSFEVVADAIGSPFTFSSRYQWKKRYWDPSAQAYVDTNVIDNNRISGATSSRLTIRDVQMVDTADTYVCYVIGYCGTIRTKDAVLFFPMIRLDYLDTVLCPSRPKSIDCVVSPTTVRGIAPSFQWYRGVAPVDDSDGLKGTQTARLAIEEPSPNEAGLYFCEVKFGIDDAQSLRSDTVEMIFGRDPVIRTQPVADTVCVGDTAMFRISVEDTTIDVQWFLNNTRIPWATEPVIQFADLRLPFSGRLFARVVGDCGTVSTDTVAFCVLTSPRITKQPEDITVFDGDMVRFTVETDEQEPLTYQWFRNDSLLDSSNAATYEVEASVAATEAGEYFCVVSNQCGSDTSNVVTASITVGVQEADVLTGGYLLGMPQPNPATDMMHITYAVPSATAVRITLVNALGMPVATLVDGLTESGNHRTEIDLRSAQVAPGMYLVDFQAGSVRAARHVIVVR